MPILLNNINSWFVQLHLHEGIIKKRVFKVFFLGVVSDESSITVEANIVKIGLKKWYIKVKVQCFTKRLNNTLDKNSEDAMCAFPFTIGPNTRNNNLILIKTKWDLNMSLISPQKEKIWSL